MRRAPIFDNAFNPEAQTVDKVTGEMRQINVEELTIGMYVEELDKPWADSEFLLQGFFIKNKMDIDAVKAECSFVTINASRQKTTEKPAKKARHAALTGEVKKPVSKEIKWH